MRGGDGNGEELVFEEDENELINIRQTFFPFFLRNFYHTIFSFCLWNACLSQRTKKNPHRMFIHQRGEYKKERKKEGGRGGGK